MNIKECLFIIKYFLPLVVVIFIGCNGEPAIAPSTPETVWVDALTSGDTIITNVDDEAAVIYFAYKNWPALSVDPAISHGYRFIAIRQDDTILVKPLGDETTNYDGPFICGNSQNADTLTSQNFLNTAAVNPVRSYVKLK